MASYDFIKGKKDILDTLSSKTKVEKTKEIPTSEGEYTYENGVKTWVASLFVDIVDSTSLFSLENVSEDGLARIMRAFVEQVVNILNQNENKIEIGIRGDCVYAVFKASYKKDLASIFRTAYCVNTFLRMFNELLIQNSYPSVSAGIGLGCGEDLIIRAGKKRVVSDRIWIGSALVDASNLSKIANRNGIDPICMDDLFYSNIIDIFKEENSEYSNWIKAKRTYGYEGTFYMCNIVQTNFDEWIDKGMK